jgi:hypothetical protein
MLERIRDVLWPWGRIRRLKNALNQALTDNAVLHDKLSNTEEKIDKLTDRDERGRFKR